MNKLLYMQRSTTANQQQRLQLSHAIRYLCSRWQQGTLMILAFLFSLGVQARTGELPQDITLSFRDATLDKVFKEIRKQTGYSFVYTESEISRANKVTIQVSNSSLDRVLSLCFQDQPLTYTIVDKIVVVKPRQERVKAVPVVNNLAAGNPKKISMRGRVLSEKGDPLAGATITVRRTDMSTTTDGEGYFALSEIEEDAVLVVSSVGHVTQQVKLSATKLNMEIKLPIAVKDEEEVVVAYNKVSSRSNVGAVTVVKGEQIESLPNRSFDKSLQGLVPGLLVTSGNGQPGSAPSNFILRGIATGGQPTTGQTYRNPLIVIDGVPVSQDPPNMGRVQSDGSPMINPMAQLNPSDIETITVLKDAAAVALYGSKASNGVILVVTKKGKAGRTVYNFRHQTDISSRLDGGVKMLNQQEYLELLSEAYRNSNPTMTDAQIRSDLYTKFPFKVTPSGDTSFYPADNWMDALYKKAAVSLINEISMSGGSEKSNFYLNVEYTKQDGIVKNTSFDRKSIRFNYEHRPSAGFKLGLNTALSYSVQNISNDAAAFRILQISPLNPIYNEAGEYFYNYGWGLSNSQSYLLPNPVAESEINFNRNMGYRGLAKLYGELKFLKFFTIASNLGFDFSLNEIKEKIHPFLAIGGDLDDGGNLRQGNFRNANIITTNTLRFDLVANRNHKINILSGQEAQVLSKKNTELTKYNFLSNPSQDQLNSGDILSASDLEGKQTMLSWFGQMNYGFRNKYFLTGSLRADGSSLFGRNERFGTYWSIGGSWVLSEETFLKKKISWINFFKLRGSFGPAGNSAAILDYFRYDFLRRASPDAVLPDNYRNPGNAEIQWENTFTWDAGLELRILEERIAVTADIYTRKTQNLIANNVPLALVTGFTTITSNVGDISNKGVELSLTARIINSKSFSWNMSANWSQNKNKLTRSNLPQEGIPGSSVINKVGEEYNAFYLPQWAGVNPANGRPMWIDSTGKPNENLNAAKKIIPGKVQPDGFGSILNTFSWKGLTLSAMVYYQYGSHILYAGQDMQNDGLNPYVNQSKAALNRWQKTGDIVENPRRLFNGRVGSEIDQGTITSTRYLFKGDFVRLSNVSLSYNLSKGFLNAIHLSNLKVFIQGHNLATWTPYSGQDPENINSMGSGNFLYPQQRSFSAGINASF